MQHGYAAIRAEEIVEAGLRHAKPVTCTKCGTAVLKGDDDDKVAFYATADVEPVDKLGEVFALLDGLRTYDIVAARGKHIAAGTFKMYSRYRERNEGPILVEHRCNRTRL